MKKVKKLKDNKYLSTECIVHGNKQLSKVLNEQNTEYFEWTPKLSCLTSSEAPTVEYTVRKGHGCKIRINDILSIVFVQCFIRGNITAVSSGNNYASIEGLLHSQALSYGYPSFIFNDFCQGINLNHPIPTGFINNKRIQIQNGNRGASVEKWIVCSSFEIQGSGFYFTSE